MLEGGGRGEKEQDSHRKYEWLSGHKWGRGGAGSKNSERFPGTRLSEAFNARPRSQDFSQGQCGPLALKVGCRAKWHSQIHTVEQILKVSLLAQFPLLSRGGEHDWESGQNPLAAPLAPRERAACPATCCRHISTAAEALRALVQDTGGLGPHSCSVQRHSDR